MMNIGLHTIKKNYEIIFLILILVGYVFFSSLSWLFDIENSRLFAVPYRILVFLFSILIVFKSVASSRFYFKILIPLLTFWIFYFLKALYSFQIDTYLPIFIKQENEIYLRIFLVNLVPCLALLSIDYSVINFKTLVKFIFWILFMSLTVNFLYTVFYLNMYNKVSGVFAVYYITSGHFGVSMVVLSSYLLFFNSYKVTLVKREFLIIGILLGFFALYISAARSPLLALMVIWLYFVLLKRNYKYIYLFVFLLLLSILLLYVCRQVLHIDSAFVERNYIAIFEGNASGRTPYFYRAIEIFKANPLFGGRLMYEDGMYPHNIFLELLMCGGIFLFLLFGLFFLPLLKKATYFLQFSDSKFYILPIFGFWMQYFVLSLTSNNIISNPEFWYFSCVVIAISINIYNEKTKSNDGSWNPSGNY